jgi:hypothetical protein
VPGRLYALAGLKRTNPSLFPVVVQPFKLWPGEVSTFFGCIISGEKVSELVASRGPNPARLRRGETLEQWWERRGRGHEWSVDIVGGGYSSMFLDPPRRRALGPAV